MNLVLRCAYLGLKQKWNQLLVLYITNMLFLVTQHLQITDITIEMVLIM